MAVAFFADTFFVAFLAAAFFVAAFVDALCTAGRRITFFAVAIFPLF